MLIVAEHFERTDTGRQRRDNEDAKFARSPLFAVADGMGGAQAGEVASATAIGVLEPGLPDGPSAAEERLAGLVREANAQVHGLSRSDEALAGMGTTMTAAYVGEEELVIAHVGDSRLYCLRGDGYERLTRDHTLVEDLVQEGRLTPEEADVHPQRSIITRALGPESDVAVDHMTWSAQAGDIYLICSDGLTGMVPEAQVARIVHGSRTLAQAGQALIDAANAAGGRDNITVVLFRVGELDPAGAGAPQTSAGAAREEEATCAHPPVAVSAGVLGAGRDDAAVTPPHAHRGVRRRQPRLPGDDPRNTRVGGRRSPSRVRKALRASVVVLVIGIPVVFGGWIASRSVFFVGSDDQGLVTLYRGIPWDGPFGIALYGTNYTSGVPTSTLPPGVQKTVRDHELRSREDGADLVGQIERGTLAGQGG